MAVYEARWDCTSCGTRAIRGPLTRCPNCDSPRPKDVRFYLPEDSEEVNDEKHKEAAHGGADWICSHCQSQNKASETECHACGNVRDESSEDVNLTERTYAPGEVPQESFAPKRTLHPSEQPQKKKKRGSRGFRTILMAAAVLFGGWFLLRTFPNKVQVEVTTFHWERQIQLQHREVVSHEDWSTPGGAFDIESFRAVKSYKQVLRGYETRTRKVKVQTGTERYVCGKIDKGNGYFVDKYCTRPTYEYRDETYEAPVYDKVPIYATKYRYKIHEWVSRDANIIKAAGKDHDPRWPEDSRLRQSDEWRAGPKDATYEITVRESNGSTHREKVPEKTWINLNQGQKITARKAYILGTWYGLEI